MMACTIGTVQCFSSIVEARVPHFLQIKQSVQTFCKYTSKRQIKKKKVKMKEAIKVNASKNIMIKYQQLIRIPNLSKIGLFFEAHCLSARGIFSF